MMVIMKMARKMVTKMMLTMLTMMMMIMANLFTRGRASSPIGETGTKYRETLAIHL